jgi:hypothetical protein
MVGLGIFGVVLCLAVAVIYSLWQKGHCPECGSTEHKVVEWVHYGHDRPVRRCECGHTWCDYPGLEVEAKDE